MGRKSREKRQRRTTPLDPSTLTQAMTARLIVEMLENGNTPEAIAAILLDYQLPLLTHQPQTQILTLLATIARDYTTLTPTEWAKTKNALYLLTEPFLAPEADI